MKQRKEVSVFIPALRWNELCFCTETSFDKDRLIYSTPLVCYFKANAILRSFLNKMYPFVKVAFIESGSL